MQVCQFSHRAFGTRLRLTEVHKRPEAAGAVIVKT
jgi:hypothetical protein